MDNNSHMVIRASLSAIPNIGGPLAELFSHFVPEPQNKRIEGFLASVNDRMRAIEFDIRHVTDQESFISSLYRAVELARRNHTSIKLGLIRDALVSGYADKWDFDRVEMTMKVADELEEYSILLLTYLHEQEENLSHSDSKQELYNAVKDRFPGGLERSMFIRSINALVNNALIEISTSMVQMEGIYESSHLVMEGKESDDPTEPKTFLITDFGKSICTLVASGSQE